MLSRTDRLGDLILSTPTIATMRRSFPDARITLVCSRHNAVVVERSPDCDEIVCVEPDQTPEAAGRPFRGADLAIALAPRAFDMRLAAATGAGCRIGYTYVRRWATRLVARRWVTELLVSEADPDLADRDPSRAVRHEVDQVLALAYAAGARAVVPALRVTIADADREAAADLPAGAIVLHIGKRWGEAGSSPESLAQLCRDLRALGRPLIATYGEDGAALAAGIADAGVADRVLGNLTFGAWAAVFARAACVVTIDTGATHVAAAMGTPTVVLFEYRYFRLNSQEWSPYRVPNAVLRKPRSDDPNALRASRAEIVAAVTSLL